MSDDHSAFRAVPRTGVIYVTTEAQKHGFSSTDPQWCNLGQGQPETGDLPGSPPRVKRVEIALDDQEYAPVAGVWELREAVASRTLDEVLAAKNALDAELRAFVRERLAETGIEVTELGVKDVILPGEIRELVNKVVEAERTAKANQIRRQEETAATRSLLNTAKLMEDNPLLLRLKELESLERLVEKVGRIDLHAGEGQGFDALLNKLVRLKADAPA